MANISTPGRSHSRKPVAIDVPLVPFLDLLLCCVMFLLVTAVWNELASLRASQRVPGASMDLPDQALELRLTLTVRDAGYELSSSTGERQWIEGHDAATLRKALEARKVLEEGGQKLTVTADDGVRYAAIVDAMDVAISCGYARLDVGNET